MPELLVEVGAEEIPASFVARALADLPKRMQQALDAARLEHGAVRPYGTPRRLAVVVEGLSERQPDKTETMLGPPTSAAFGPDGKPTAAAIGFAKKCGVEVGALKTVDSDKGPRLCADKHDEGQAADVLLPAIVAEVFAKIPFAKTMRWGEGVGPFARPIHWIVCLFGGRVLPVELAGVRAGAETRGHRFLAPAAFAVKDAADWLARLRKAHVLADPAERLGRVRIEIERAQQGTGGGFVEDSALELEVRDLVEEPFAIVGGFDPALLALPREVIVQAMRGHQRYFAMEDRDHRLLAKFVSIANTAENVANVRRGNERVLTARLKDAKFFFDEDQKKPLDARVEALDGIVFAKGLGTMRRKVERVSKVAHALAEALGTEVAASERAQIDRACALMKADLTTQMVGEFPELQGIVGAEYAARSGESAAVAAAIREHYQPRTVDGELPATPLGRLLAVADRLDSIASFFSAGLQPTGAADPYGVKKAAIAVVRVLMGAGWRLPLRTILGATGREAVVEAVAEFLFTRLKGLLDLEGEGMAPDVVLAALSSSPDDLCDAASRARALSKFRGRDDFMNLAISFKRSYNITKDVAPGEVRPALFERDEERGLAAAFDEMKPRFGGLIAGRDYDGALDLVGRSLRVPIDRYFDKVFVMVDDPEVRQNRLRLLRDIADTLSLVAHFHLLQTEIDVKKGTVTEGRSSARAERRGHP